MPGLGTTGEAKKQGFTLAFNWSRERANQLFTYSHPNNAVDAAAVLPYRASDLIEATALYQINPKSSLALTLPLSLASFKLNFPIPGTSLSQRFTQRANNISDVSIVYRSLIFSPKVTTTSNASLGLGLVLPTGSWTSTSVYPDGTGGNISSKPVLHSIMPGQGGVGIYTEVQAFKVNSLPVKGTTHWLFGSYVIQPMGQTNTTSFPESLFPGAPQLINAHRNSIPDNYLVRWGSFIPIPKVKDLTYLRGLTLFAGGRLSGVPVRDLIGPNPGYRQPGMALAVEPGLSYTLKRYNITLTTPIFFFRNSQPNPAQIPGGPPGPLRNLATISPWSLNLQVSRRF